MDRADINIFEKSRFSCFLDVLDSKMKQVQSLGKQELCKRAEMISNEAEDLLREKGLLGDHSPSVLLDMFCVKKRTGPQMAKALTFSVKVGEW